MKIIDETSSPEDGAENSGIGAEPINTKSAAKQPSGATNTDQNPDKV